MKNKLYILLLISFSFSQAQERIEVAHKETIKLDADNFIGMNMFDELYYVKNEVLYKKAKEELFSYQNRLLGSLSSIGGLNSLETNLFYKDFNTVVKLDKKLGKISKIDFNSSTIFSTITHVASASNKRFRSLQLAIP